MPRPDPPPAHPATPESERTDPSAPIYEDTDPAAPVVEEPGGATGVGVIDGFLNRRPALQSWVSRRPAVRHFLALLGPSGRPLRQRIPFPWGLLILIAGYALLVTGWTAYRYWTSPEYKAAVAYEEAWSLLGKDGGRTAPMHDVERAFSLLVEAGYLMPQVKTIHENLESLRWRYEERGVPLPRPLEFGAEEASRRWLEIEEARQPILVVGARDRGWDFETLSRGPKTVLLWSVVLAILLTLVGLYFWWIGVVAEWERREEHVQEVERDVKALGRFRDGLK